MTRLLVNILLIATLGATGCHASSANERAAAESAFKGFSALLRSSNSEGVWQFLDGSTQTALQQRADALAAAGSPVAHPAELLLVGWVPDQAGTRELRRVEETDEAVTLEIETEHGYVAQVLMVRTETGWQVSLPIDG
ncbi:MAG: hypothetical protein ACI81R_003425 [Bradymonadia bacterium]|jgi:hypothetical protein